MQATKLKSVRLTRRIRRVRKKVSGTSERPRLAVARSHRNIGAQLVDDVSGRTLCALSTRSKGFRDEVGYGGNVKAAAALGQALAERAKALGIQTVCLDRRGRKYHGRIKALAEAARKAGLKF